MGKVLLAVGFLARRIGKYLITITKRNPAISGLSSKIIPYSSLLLILALESTLFGQIAVTTYHNDLNRTGANLNENILNTSNVLVNSFGKLFSRTVDGQIYAQPLYVPHLQIPANHGQHNVVYVATEHNSVYAFDADNSAAGIPLWHVNLGPSLLSDATQDVVPEVGITGTPVIDLRGEALYVVAKTWESGNATFRLHALDLKTGSEKFLGPVKIQGSVPGRGDGSNNGILAFDPFMQHQRPGLLLLNGNVYVAFGGHVDTPPYHGWLFAYTAETLKPVSILCVSPNGYGSGVWQGGVGPAADANGSIYFQTGNGSMDAITGGSDFGDSLVKVSTTSGLAIVDYFTPSNQFALDAHDIDFGSSGPLLIPGTSFGVTGGKDGKLFLFDTKKLGGFHSADQVIQEWQATYSLLSAGAGGIFGGSVYYNQALYVWGARDSLKSFSFDGSTFNTTPTSQSAVTIPYAYSNEPSMSVSANHTAPGTGILWAAHPTEGDANWNDHTPGILRAFDASDLTKELWNSNQNMARDSSGSWAKWAPPTIANGKVYLATFDNILNVYGLLAKK